MPVTSDGAAINPDWEAGSLCSVRSPGSSDSSEIHRRDELRREGAPVWSVASHRSREEVLARDRSGPARATNPLDEYLLEANEDAEESTGGEDDPFATDSDDRGRVRDGEGDFHTTAGLGDDEEVNTEDLSPLSWPSPL